ncbi:uncharacterized protein I206_104906 [Kwoniella pini CBS 10737]|uniref:Uncharacterized protein n=1 Tax=Kwoniella pini CBS 10737 TaxID=1296096 RepID=A0A1B9I8K7_9TREE|nr:uncharacterized protein I206_02446 [Kwoniella pini CBS 10737]OCF51731.1 hypothetical protein I206_02446 [Kwoniella pini CBS 10737]
MNAMAPSMSPTSSSTGLATGPSMTSTAQHRLSLSGRQRRPSPLLHEIQPPSRRLSAHQMLLLTPFGGPLPAGALAGAGGSGMSRGSSSMGHTMSTAPAKMGNSSNWPGKDSSSSVTGTNPVQLGREIPIAGRQPSISGSGQSMGRETPPANRFPPRSRHSLGHSMAGPSPLASAPMTTIFSQGSSEGQSSRSQNSSGQETETNQMFISREEIGIEVRSQRTDGGDVEEDVEMMSPPKTRLRLLSATVAMTRSNSLPVLTLRELEALKEKDGELGIQRGGDWAWVSRDTDDLDDPDLETPSMDTETSTNASTSSTSLVTPFEQPLSASSSSSSSYRNPFTSFNDPFAPRQPGISPVSAYIPTATSSDYHYSPSGVAGELRRMSDAPPQASASVTPSPTHRTGRRSDIDSRRPSAPHAYNQAYGSLTPKAFQRRTPPQASQSIFQPSYQPLAPPEETSPHGSPIADFPPASRPRLLRYKSSPARTTGLGLNIVVRPTGSGRNSGSEKSPGDTGSAGTHRDSRGSLGEQSIRSGPSRSSFSSGRWAEVDFIDSLAATADAVLTSTSESNFNVDTNSYSQSSNISDVSRPSSSIGSTTFVNRDLTNSRISNSSVNTSISPTRRERRFSSNNRIGIKSEPQTAIKSGFKIEQISSRSHIIDFQIESTIVFGENQSPIFKGRSRFESVDSAFPLMPGGKGERLSVPNQTSSSSNFINDLSSFNNVNIGFGNNQNILNEGFPRRGSLGMGTFAKLRNKMINKNNDKINDNHNININHDGIDELGQRLNVNLQPSAGSNSTHWSERRGSWAEGWSSGR